MSIKAINCICYIYINFYLNNVLSFLIAVVRFVTLCLFIFFIPKLFLINKNSVSLK